MCCICFQKKSPSGIRTAQSDIDLIHERLKLAQQHDKDHHEHNRGLGRIYCEILGSRKVGVFNANTQGVGSTASISGVKGPSPKTSCVKNQVFLTQGVGACGAGHRNEQPIDDGRGLGCDRAVPVLNGHAVWQ